jgi:RNA polymerase sigma-70 factor (ECF subfamily)
MDKDLDDADKVRRFETTILPHLDAAYSLARWLTRHTQDAEDVTQMACVRAFRFFNGYHGGDARAWLLTIVRHTYFNAWRDQARQRQEVPLEEEQYQAEESDESYNPESLLARRDAHRLLNQALRELPQPYREVIVLKELSELSYQEIADLAGIPIGTVMSRLARARKQLLQLLHQAGQGV